MVHPTSSFKKYTFIINQHDYKSQQPWLWNNLSLVADWWEMEEVPTTHHYALTCLRMDAYKVEKTLKKFKIKIY